MPAVTQVTLFDDEAWPERVQAEEVVRVAVHWQDVEGPEHEQESFELYLTTAGRQKLAADLDHWREIGHRPGVKTGASLPEEPKRSKGMRAGPVTIRGSATRREWKARMRDWSDSLNLRNPHNANFPAWKTTTDKHYYPADLEDGFVLHEQGREEEALAKVAQFMPEAA